MTNAPVTNAAETPAELKNDTRIKDLIKQVTKLGEEASLGKDSLPKLAHAIVNACVDGVINADDKDDKGNDAAAQIYAKYAAAESKKAIHEHSAGGLKANVSKLRQLIAMGCMTGIDAKEVMSDAFTARENMINDSEKVLPAYPFYVAVAREQLKSEKKQLTTEQLEKLALKGEPAPKELEAVLKRIEKMLEDIVTGEGRDKLKDTDELTEAAFQAIRERTAKFATLRAHQSIREAAAKLGLKLA